MHLQCEDLNRVQWRGRWSQFRAVEHYIQEVAAQTLLHTLDPCARHRIKSFSDATSLLISFLVDSVKALWWWKRGSRDIHPHLWEDLCRAGKCRLMQSINWWSSNTWLWSSTWPLPNPPEEGEPRYPSNFSYFAVSPAVSFFCSSSDFDGFISWPIPAIWEDLCRAGKMQIDIYIYIYVWKQQGLFSSYRLFKKVMDVDLVRFFKGLNWHHRKMLVVVGETQHVQSAILRSFVYQIVSFKATNKEWFNITFDLADSAQIQSALRGLMGHVFDQYNHLMHQEPEVIFLFFSEKTQILVEKLDVLTQTVLVLKSSFSDFMNHDWVQKGHLKCFGSFNSVQG